jgi:hypothetical protein
MTPDEPMLLRFAQPLPTQVPPALRFDSVKQLSEVNQNGRWVTACRNSELLGKGETKTAVSSESTDYR